jgi:hypothetical protein
LTRQSIVNVGNLVFTKPDDIAVIDILAFIGNV